jgi:hypothetical protein
MRKIFTMLILTVFCVGFGNAQKVPEGLQKEISNYFKDSTVAQGFDYAQRTFQIKFSDIYAGVPIEIFTINMEKLANLNDTEAVDAFIMPVGRWDIPIYAKKHCIYFIMAYPRGDSWYIGGSTCCESKDGWDKVRAAWPENKGVNPVKVELGPLQMMYFPQKNNHNLILMNGFDTSFITKDFKVLKDSKILISHLKERKVQADKWFKDHPEDLGLPENGGYNGK